MGRLSRCYCLLKPRKTENVLCHRTHYTIVITQQKRKTSRNWNAFIRQSEKQYLQGNTTNGCTILNDDPIPPSSGGLNGPLSTDKRNLRRVPKCLSSRLRTVSSVVPC